MNANPSIRSDRHRVVVIGAGITGLATAALLASDGHDVEVLERNQEIGGRARTWEQDGFRFDLGPSWYLMPEVFDHFFRLLGTSADEQLDLRRLDPGYRVFSEDAEPVDVVGDRHVDADQFERIEPGAGRALERYLDSAGEAYRIAVDHFLHTSWESPTRTLAAMRHPDVLTRGARLAKLLTQSLDTFVADQFADPRLRQILGYAAVFLGGSPNRIPALYHLMSSMDLDDGVLYPHGGFGTLIHAIAQLARAAGARIRTGTEVVGIDTRPLSDAERRLSSWRPIRRTHRAYVNGVLHRPSGTDPDAAVTHLAADIVVGAGDLHHLETELLPATLQTFPATWWEKRDPGPGAVLVHLGIEGALPQLPHHSLCFATDWERNFDDVFVERRIPHPASTYVCRPSATDDTAAPPGHENVFVLVPVPADVAIGRGGVNGAGDADVEKVADAAIDQIATWAGVPTLADRVVLRRTVGPADFADELHAWSGGALGLAHSLRQSAFFRGPNASKHVDGLLYAGSSTLPGIGLPMCLISAQLIAKRIRGDRSGTPMTSPNVPRPRRGRR